MHCSKPAAVSADTDTWEEAGCGCDAFSSSPPNALARASMLIGLTQT